MTFNNGGALRVGASISLSTKRGITLQSGGGSLQVASGDTVTYGGVIAGSGSFASGTTVSTGEGTLILSGANTYTGPTTIACGTLQLGANGTLPSATALTIESADVGGTLNMNGFSQTIGSLSSGTGIGGTGTVTPSINLTGALTVNQTGSTTYAGAINGSGGSLNLTGSGVLTLAGANAYTGPTTISAGTLALGGSASVNNTVGVSIAAGATFDVSAIGSYTLGSSTTLYAAGTSSPATINGGTTVSLGSQAVVLTYDGWIQP